MQLERRLSHTLLEAHPFAAARALEALGAGEAAEVMADAPAAHSAAALGTAVPHFSASVLERVGAGRAAELLAALPFDVAVALLRRLDPEARAARLAALPDPLAETLGPLLRHPEGTAGALMDPRAVALAEDHTAVEALRELRASAERALYNLYVVDRAQRLVGVLNLRELLLARAGERLGSAMRAAVHRLRADADRHAIVSHPGWREVHSLPVVDAGSRLLGAIRYRTLRRLEDEIRGEERGGATPTVAALGDLFGTALAGWVDALAAAVAPASRERS